tara:strand:- start:1871 stop:2827 length:957 start_codon:yes stop_codon:yes gene_type:complete
MKKKILILGASGFIGQNCLHYFAKNKQYKNYKIVGTYFKKKPKNIKNVKLIKVDLTDKKIPQSIFKNTNILIQAAACTTGAKDIVSKPYMHVNDNVVMNSFVTKFAHKYKISHVIIFSCTVMYKSSNKPLREIDFNPNDQMYEKYFGAGWMKVFVEKMSEFYSRFKITKYTLIRHSNVYGPFDKFDLQKSHVFGATINKVSKTKENYLNVWGDGKEKRNFLYVSDLISFIDLVIKRQKKYFEIYNLGSDKSISINTLVKNIIKLSSKKLKIKNLKNKPTLKTSIEISSLKAKTEIGWRQKISLKEGILKTLNWYKNNS